MTTPEEKTDLKKIVNAILKEISTIEAIYLFGSLAKEKKTKKAITTLQ